MDSDQNSESPEVDIRFRQDFEQEWRRHFDRLGNDISVLIRLGDDLHHCYAGEVRQAAVVGARYNALKRLAHLPIRVFLSRLAESAPEEQPAVDSSVLNELDGCEAERSAATKLVGLIEAFWSATRNSMDRQTLQQFANEIHAPVQRLIRAAANLEVSRLHATMADLAERTPSDVWRTGYYCVVGGNAPRYKELTTQYFRRYLTQQGLARGGVEHQLIYAEGDHDAESVFELIAKRHLNRELGELFFGSAMALEQDVLGDAANLALQRCFSEAPVSGGNGA